VAKATGHRRLTDGLDDRRRAQAFGDYLGLLAPDRPASKTEVGATVDLEETLADPLVDNFAAQSVRGN